MIRYLMERMSQIALAMLAAVWVGMIWLLLRVRSSAGGYFEPQWTAPVLFAAAGVASAVALEAFARTWRREEARPLAMFWLGVFVTWACALFLTFAARH